MVFPIGKKETVIWRWYISLKRLRETFPKLKELEGASNIKWSTSDNIWTSYFFHSKGGVS